MIVIDTHVWIWWTGRHPRLRPAVRDRLEVETDVRVSAISLVEITTAISAGRLVVRPSPRDWMDIAQSVEQLRVEPLTAARCLASIELPGQFHRDPGDRLIVALARELDTELVTADDKILRYDGVRTVRAG